MAKPSWLVVDPESGSGNGKIANSSKAPHTGRNSRTGTVTVTAVGASTPATYTVTQSPKPEFVFFDNGTEMAINKAGGSVVVEGKSNAVKLTFSWGGEVTDVTLPAKYQANGTATDNGANITGDPGATAQFPFSVTLEVPANTTIEEIVRNLIVTSGGNKSSQIALKQAAGDPFIEVTPTEITLDADGSAVSVDVTSNTSWTVS